jgi:imidazole glycerol phosphate synthase subunit HisF
MANYNYAISIHCNDEDTHKKTLTVGRIAKKAKELSLDLEVDANARLKRDGRVWPVVVMSGSGKRDAVLEIAKYAIEKGVGEIVVNTAKLPNVTTEEK